MKRLLIIFLTIFVYHSQIMAQDEQQILGKWTNEDHSQIIQVIKKNNVYIGKLVKH